MIDNITYVGVFDNDIDLFEGQYKVPEGIAYNSYLVRGARVAVMDSVDGRFASEWLANIEAQLGTRAPDYLVVQHMEPDHSGAIGAFLAKYPSATLVASAKAHNMMSAFLGFVPECEKITVQDGDTLDLGEFSLKFFTAAMVHWPEVVVTLEEKTGTLFSADAFGRFGSTAEDDEWVSEARRYYIGIVGKFGAAVQALLKKLSGQKITRIAPLHGPVLTKELEKYLSIYNVWSSYQPENNDAVIAYASIYGGTGKAANMLADIIKEKTGTSPEVYDLARSDKHLVIAEAFRYKTVVLAASTYNGSTFPPMREFLAELCGRGYTNRRVFLIENGSWAPMAAKTMREALSALKGLDISDTQVTIKSAPNNETKAQLEKMADEIINN